MNLALSPAAGWTALFVLALLLSSGLRLWLASRQIRHVARHRGRVPAVFANAVPLPAHQKAADYTIAKIRLGLVDLALGAALLLGWTLLGGLTTLDQWLTSTMGSGMAQQISLIVAFACIGAVAELPLGWYQTFVLEQRFGFNQMRPALWLADLARSALLGALIGVPLVWMVLWLMAAAGSYWWWWAWVAWTAFNLLLLWAYPTWIAPLFNKFTPIEDESLRARVTALMERCGFAAKGLFVMDGSRRSAHGNAYFTGFGSAKRVVFYDTLLSRLMPAEVDAVLAHELGHFRHRHVAKRLCAMFALSLAAFALLGWLATQSWFFVGLGVAPHLTSNAPNDALALLLFLLVIPVFGSFVSPLLAQVSRRHEFEADAYAVQQTSAADLSNALLKLYEDNAATLTPDPVYASVYYSHPPATERLARMATA